MHTALNHVHLAAMAVTTGMWPAMGDEETAVLALLESAVQQLHALSLQQALADREGVPLPRPARASSPPLVSTLSLTCGPAQLREVRSGVMNLLSIWEIDPAAADIACDLAQELATTAVRYGQPPVELSLEVTAEDVCIQVRDSCQVPVGFRTRPEPSPHELTDYLVRRMDGSWSQTIDGAGKCVSARVPRSPRTIDLAPADHEGSRIESTAP
jgi:hypothetical protein